MRLEAFIYYLEICENGSIAKTAEKNYMLRQTLSAIISETEHQLGFPLLERHSNGCIPTKQGKMVLEHVKVLCESYQNIVNIGNNKSLIQGNISLGLMNGFSRETLNNITLECIRKYPSIQLHTTIAQPGNCKDLFDLLKEKKLNILYCGFHESELSYYKSMLPNTWDIEVLSFEESFFIMNHNNPLSSRKNICISDLIDQSLVVASNDKRKINIFQPYCKQIIQSFDLNSIFKLISTENFITFLPKRLLSDFNDYNFSTIPCADETLKYDLHVCVHRFDSLLSDVESAFLKILKSQTAKFYEKK